MNSPNVTVSWYILFENLQQEIIIPETATWAIPGKYGPYLENFNPMYPPMASSYVPIWTSYRGGTNEGWRIRIYKNTKSVEVVPSSNVTTIEII